jgi:hypothetical protein
VPDDVCERGGDARLLGESARSAHGPVDPGVTAAARCQHGPDVRAHRRGGRRPSAILSGAEEARLTFAAFRRKLKIGRASRSASISAAAASS